MLKSLPRSTDMPDGAGGKGGDAGNLRVRVPPLLGGRTLASL
jgi:hypothetical protein